MNQTTSFLSHAKVISALTLLSRVFGLLRETALAAFLGTGVVATAFRAAFAVPNMFRKLFGEGALSAAFIPLYVQSLKEDAPADARAFAAASVNVLTLILIAITLAGEILLGSLIFLADPQRLSFLLILKLSAIMLPYVVLICLTAFLGGILQVHRHFATPAFAPVLLNVVHIAVTSVGGWLLGINLLTDQAERIEQQTQLAWYLAAAVVLAGAAQIAVLIPPLRAIGFRFSLRCALWTPRVKTMLRLSVPVALAAGVLQISVAMDKGISAILAADLADDGSPITHLALWGQSIRLPMELGALPRLDVAQVLYQFPLGVFAIALATAIFPGLSHDRLETDQSRFRQTLCSGLEATLFEGIAASIGLIIIRYQAVRLFVKWGQITEHDVALIARSLAIYASGVWAYSMQQIINRAYYALHDTRTPFIWSIINILLNLVIELPLLWSPLGESAMAMGTAASFAVQSLFMLCMLPRRVGDFDLRKLVGLAGRMLLAGLLMWGACWGIQQTPVWPQGNGKLVTLMQLAELIVVGAAVYLAACRAMGVRTLSQIVGRRGWSS